MKRKIERERRSGGKRRVKLPEKLKEGRKRDREGRVKIAEEETREIERERKGGHARDTQRRERNKPVKNSNPSKVILLGKWHRSAPALGTLAARYAKCSELGAASGSSS